MREIKFRGKRRDNGEWIEGTLYQIAANLPPFIMLADSNAESHEVICETVGQFTGLTDKYGQQIAEGDVVRFDDIEEKTVVCTVSWGAARGRWELVDLDGDSFAIAGYDAIVEVIGNIHDCSSALTKGD